MSQSWKLNGLNRTVSGQLVWCIICMICFSAITILMGRLFSFSASKGGIPAWVKLLIIVVIAVIVFLVIKNMESDPASEIPEQIEVKV